MISVLIPTRLRPVRLKQSVDSIRSLARYPDKVRPLLFADDDDSTDYSAYEFVRNGPRWGYGGLHCYMNSLSRWARELDGSEPGWQVPWNDDLTMVTQDWDEKLLAYGPEPKVVFMRRDCYPADPTCPTFPSSFVDLVGNAFGGDCCYDMWLMKLTCAVDKLVGRTVTHIHAAEVAFHHDRAEQDPAWAITREPASSYPATPELKGIGLEMAVFKLADFYRADFGSPFGVVAGVPIRR
jgi:hypothetical protein